MIRTIRTTLAVLFLLLLSGCGDTSKLQVGLLAGTSGHIADLGVGGRDGAILAIEEVNRQGGINGQKIELLIRDDRNDPQLATRHANELIAAGVEAIIGPMTSAMAKVVEPIATERGVLVMGGTVATNDLTARDDYFFRTIASTREHAGRVARFHYHQGARNFAVLYDTSNLAYTKSWVNDFQLETERLGGRVLAVHPFQSSQQTFYTELTNRLIETRPDTILLVTNATDAAMVIQQIRRSEIDVRVATSEWAATERLIELGGAAAEEVYVSLYLDPYSDDPLFNKFRQRYIERFNRKPGYPGYVGYNAASILLRAMQQQEPGETLKQTLLRLAEFPVLLGSVRFDRYGDTQSPTYIMQIRKGNFEQVSRM